jgi:hypothetical protein
MTVGAASSWVLEANAAEALVKQGSASATVASMEPGTR